MGIPSPPPKREKHLEDSHVLVWDIGDEHVAGGVGDHQRWLRIHGHHLRCDAASPEDRDFICSDFRLPAKIRFVHVDNSKLVRIAHMDRCSTNRRESRADLIRPYKLIQPDRSHTRNHRPIEYSGRLAGLIGEIDRHDLSKFDMPQSNISL